MNKMTKAKKIMSILDTFFPTPQIPLLHKDPYTLLIAVVLSARSTDAMVNRVTPFLFAKADSPEKMVLLTVEEIRSIIQPVGLSPTKAKNILELSKLLIKKHKSCVPKTFASLEALPGVGHKTASVVMAQAFNKPAFPVDTHILRCAKRWGLSLGKNVKQVEKDLKKVFPKNKWIKLHLQIIYFGRAFCSARKHNPEKCPICSRIL